ncbi:hypothetical protein G6F57_010384 [Rhizopus arrhizus]|uniref:DUF155 domain-containing protein n=1 Tax=Rhizopus oryzae TaxID=64495 RepID=A0A9P6X5J6_RHIOR|nr:hypothetical protein G6F24_008083 [Rhizopus arrhizus]KAG1399516.1 hypothetical protein G6F58_011123 [Rhizopus delemar]KAG0798106.1 hypothetical protein G6F22_004548 [Rhizopus arrhizus]KAG0851464.1 hypothetical protein G6F17_008975 [Rhizopus arrhizus]KAG0873859.1 hypothetical protein G6F15_010758 [Rhizopus arrhizus]
MLHILDKEQSGEIFAFSNGSISFWGLQPSQQEKFLDLYIRDKQKSPIKESSEFTVDEDEVTDLKGDVIILNPEGIQLSKLAFSYGLGRAAKFNSIEHDLDDVMPGNNGTRSFLGSSPRAFQIDIKSRLVKKHAIQNPCGAIAALTNAQEDHVVAKEGVSSLIVPIIDLPETNINNDSEDAGDSDYVPSNESEKDSDKSQDESATDNMSIDSQEVNDLQNEAGKIAAPILEKQEYKTDARLSSDDDGIGINSSQ